MTRARLLRARGGLSVIVIIVVLTAGAIWIARATADHEISSARNREIDRTGEEAREAVLAMRETVSRTLEQIDVQHGLAALAVQARHFGDQAMERDTLAELTRLRGSISAYVRQVGAIAPSGYLEWTNIGTAGQQVYLGDREHFQQIANGSAKAFISAPVVGRVSRLRTIEFAQGVYEPNGTLLAVTVVSVEPAAFSSLATTVGVTGSDAVSIQRRDGMILARNGNGEGTVPADRKHMDMFLASQSGAAVGRSAIDGVLRSIAWQRLDDRGLIVVVGLDLQARLDRLAPAAERTRYQTRLTILLIVMAAIGIVGVSVWRRRVSAEAARMAIVRESESRFREMAESLPDAIRLLDRCGVVLYANPATMELLDVGPEAVIGHETTRFVHPDDLNNTPWQRWLQEPEKRTGRGEIRLLRPDGRVVQVQSMIHVIGDDSTPDGPPRIIVSSRDVTRQREAEAALRSTKEELDTVLNGVSGALFRYLLSDNGDSLMLYVSDSIELITGFTPAECLKPNWLKSQCDPAFEAEMPKHFQRLRTAGSSAVEFRLRHKNGTLLWYEVFARAVHDSGPLVVVGCIRDITRERERNQYTAHSAKMAVLAEMTTGIAHELSQPLTAISVVARTALEGLNPEREDQRFLHLKLQRIVQQADRAASVVDHMRIFGREARRSPETISVAAAIEGARSTADARLARSRVELLVDTTPDLPPIRGHLLPLEQVLTNLIGNAIDAIEMRTPPLPDERRRIEISAGVDAESMVLSVTDHAGGISDAALPRLFEPFFTTKPAGSGTGLGLSISYGIVIDMAGTITFRNSGDGAVFEIRLPVAKANQGILAA
nr:PAS domain S-box protein [uncultured Rhodopila sp.]